MQIPNLSAWRPPTLETRIEAPKVADTASNAPATKDFASQVGEFIQGVNGQQQTAETAANRFAKGESYDIHGTMLGMQRADISLRFVGSIRNRIIEAYREIMQMSA